MRPRDRLPAALLAVTLAGLAASGVRPADRFTWFLETVPVMIAVPVLLATRWRSPSPRCSMP